MKLSDKYSTTRRNEMNTGMAIAMITGVVIGIAGLLVISSILNGFVLVILWSWFIVPVFELPSLTIPYAIGLAMIASFLTYQWKADPENKEKMTALTLLGVAIFRPLLTLLFGYIVHMFA